MKVLIIWDDFVPFEEGWRICIVGIELKKNKVENKNKNVRLFNVYLKKCMFHYTNPYIHQNNLRFYSGQRFSKI